MELIFMDIVNDGYYEVACHLFSLILSLMSCTECVMDFDQQSDMIFESIWPILKRLSFFTQPAGVVVEIGPSLRTKQTLQMSTKLSLSKYVIRTVGIYFINMLIRVAFTRTEKVDQLVVLLYFSQFPLYTVHSSLMKLTLGVLKHYIRNKELTISSINKSI